MCRRDVCLLGKSSGGSFSLGDFFPIFISLFLLIFASLTPLPSAISEATQRNMQVIQPLKTTQHLLSCINNQCVAWVSFATVNETGLQLCS